MADLADFQTYYRIERSDLDHERLLDAAHQYSTVWAGWVEIACATCSGHGTLYAGDDLDTIGCDGCDGSGYTTISSQDGVSCCRTVADLVAYMVDRHATMDDHVIVQMRGVECDEADIDAADGALLIRPIEIVSVIGYGVSRAEGERIRAGGEAAC